MSKPYQTKALLLLLLFFPRQKNSIFLYFSWFIQFHFLPFFCFLIGVITPLSAVFHRLFQVIKIFAQSLLIPGRRHHSSCALTAPWKAHDIDEISTVTEVV